MIEMRDRLDQIKQRYNEINKLLMNPEIVTDIQRMTKLSKEQSGLEPIVRLYDDYTKVLKSIED